MNLRPINLVAMATPLALVFALSACNDNNTPAPAPAPATYSIGGTVTGLASGQSVTLQNNGGDDYTATADGSFNFATAVATGASYAVTVQTQSANQVCNVTNGSGTVGTSNVTNVEVLCKNYNLAYTADYNNSLIQAYKVNPFTGVLSTLPVNTTTDSGTTFHVAVNSAGTYLYAAEKNANSVRSFSIDAATGALTQLNNRFTTGTTPSFVLVNPAGSFVYALEGTRVDLLPVNSDGTLAAAQNTVIYGSDISGTATGMVINAAGTVAYVSVADVFGNGQVWAHSIDPDTGVFGVVSVKGLSGVNYYSITLNPAGTFVYMPESSSNFIDACPVDQATGALGTCFTAATSVGVSTRGIVFDPTGKYAYAVNGGTGSGTPGTINEFSVDATTGVLTSIGTVTGVGTYSDKIYINSAGTVVYVVNAWGPPVVAYSVDPSTGHLSSLGTTQFGVGSDSANSLAFTKP